MTKNEQITTNLLSFKTFRSPDKIDFNERNDFFIHHPNFSKSKFYNCLTKHNKENNEKQFNEVLKSVELINSYKEVRTINPAIYDYSCLLMNQKRNDSSKKQLNAKLPTPLTDDILIKLWDILLSDIALQNSATVRQASIQIIIAHQYLKNNKTIELKDISRLVVVIPEDFFDCIRNWRFSKCGGKLFGVHNLGVQEYRKVEQTLCCYVPGEISHIENVMAKEYKEKSTRNLLRTEYSTEFSSESEIENLNDTTSTERNELSTEVAKQLQKDKSFDISGSVTVSKGGKESPVSFTANVNTGYNNSSSSSLSNTEARNYAKEITERALERVVQKTTEKRTYKMIKEFEENIKHGYDNRGDEAEHITGVYRWVDKVYDNQMINYGRRLLFEISVPSPAKFYKMAMLWKSKKAETGQSTLTPPKTLEELGITNPTTITESNLTLANSTYGTTIQPYIVEEKTVDVLFNNDTKHENKRLSFQHDSILIPDGFLADRIVYGDVHMHFRANGASAYVELFINGIRVYATGDQDANSATTRDFSFSFDFTPDIAGSLSFEVSYKKVFDYNGSLKIKCVSDPKMKIEWQNETYSLLQEAYNKLQEKYNEELKLQQAEKEAQADQSATDNYSNPSMNRLIEERELKRICIEMLSKPFCYDLGQNFNECKDYKCDNNCETIENKVPEVLQNEALEKYAEFIKFFESFFHWEIFSYIFYPYYYNPKCEWSELLQTKNDDPIFEAFLQSGMAKILVPVRPQFEKAVMWYLETGEIYTDENLVPETKDDRYLSLLSELDPEKRDVPILVGDPWKTRVPSTLTIIQTESSYLKDEIGLPCCDKESNAFKNDKSKKLIGLKTTI